MTVRHVPNAEVRGAFTLLPLKACTLSGQHAAGLSANSIASIFRAVDLAAQPCPNIIGANDGSNDASDPDGSENAAIGNKSAKFEGCRPYSG